MAAQYFLCDLSKFHKIGIEFTQHIKLKLIIMALLPSLEVVAVFDIAITV